MQDHAGKWLLPVLVVTSIFFSGGSLFAQYKSQFHLRWTEKSERTRAQDRIIRNVIYGSLKTSLDSTTEDLWAGAFNSMEVINYHDSFTTLKMTEAVRAMPVMSTDFQRSVLEAAYTLYPGNFTLNVEDLLKTTEDPKIFAMCAVYLMKSDDNRKERILNQLGKSFDRIEIQEHPVLRSLYHMITQAPQKSLPGKNVLKSLLGKGFLPGKVVVYSLQRKNRDYPGIVIIRKKDGSFVMKDGKVFNVPQLARGISGLPYFLSKGNTPQGIYRIYGFGVSKNRLIGPTVNIQMGMPVELSKIKFFNLQTDKINKWSKEDYSRLLPVELRNFEPLYESYYAGLAGRSEIIAHGTTINPEYYKGKPYYPLTPTEGCLSTREVWNGKLVESDQEKLVNALLEAGGASGYLLVLELDNQKRPVSLDEIQLFLSGQ